MNSPLKILLAVLLLSLSGRAYSQVDTIVWQQLSPLPTSNPTIGIGSAYFLIDSDFYVAGGQCSGTGTLTGKVWKYHIPTDTWIEMQNMPFGPSETLSSFVLNGKGYFLSDYDSLSNNNCDTMFWEYNPIVDTWARKANFPDEPRDDESSFSYGGKGYVGFTYGCKGADNHLWQYDPVMDTWTQMPSLVGSISFGRAGVCNTSPYAYFVGGETFLGNFINDIWRYNIDSRSWDSLGQMPGTPRCFPVVWEFDSLLIGGGGTNLDALFNDFYLYNIATNLWTPVVFQNSFDSTGLGATFIYNKMGYYFGGYSTINPTATSNNNMWSFDASKFLPDTTTGITQVKNQATFSVYPNPVSHEQGISVSTSESGSIAFYDALGRLLDERRLVHGINPIRLKTDEEVVIYHATLSSGATQTGKVVFIR